ncbi:hypothetical protein ACWOBL_04610 [Gemella bergeri]
MKWEEVFKIFKDYFTFNIPLGVVLLILIAVLFVFNSLYKQIKSGFETQIQEYRETNSSLIKTYQENIKQLNKRISSLENRLDNKFKGGKKRWM